MKKKIRSKSQDLISQPLLTSSTSKAVAVIISKHYHETIHFPFFLNLFIAFHKFLGAGFRDCVLIFG